MGEWLDALLRSDLFTFFQLQGCLVFALLSLGWAWAGIRRGQELQRMLAAGQLRRSEDEVPPPAGTGGPLPAITVVMPVKGCRAHSASNWRSHLNLQYDGPRQLLFVVESDADAAYQPLQALIKQLPQRDAAVLVAGCSTSCSQKLHNMAAGVAAAAPASKYVLFLDDDVDLHDSAAQALVQVLERDPRLFMATGYPMDVPPRGASLAAYCMLAYHLPLVVAFSLGDTAQFVWGGCMLLPLDALRDDRHVQSTRSMRSRCTESQHATYNCTTARLHKTE